MLRCTLRAAVLTAICCNACRSRVTCRQLSGSATDNTKLNNSGKTSDDEMISDMIKEHSQYLRSILLVVTNFLDEP